MKTKSFTESIKLKLPALSDDDRQIVTEALDASEGTALEVEFAAIHEGLTRNNTFYTKEGLTHKNKNELGQPGGLRSWLEPYAAPLIKDHDKRDADKVIGRAVGSRWAESEGKEPGHVALKFRVTNPEAIEKFMRGEYLTGSVGQEVDSALCSICAHDMVESDMMCEHIPGKYYAKAPRESEEAETTWQEVKPMTKGSKRAYVVMGNSWGREYSIVSTPSDNKSKVKAMAEVTEMTLVAENDDIIMDFINRANVEETITEEEVAIPEALEEVPEQTEVVETPETATVASGQLVLTDEMIAQIRDNVLNSLKLNTETTAVEETPTEEVDTTRSVAELCEMFRAQLEVDVLSLYINLAGWLESDNIAVSLNDSTLTNPELKALISHIENSNEDLEIELKELKDAVLSNEERNSLPDTAFALVKVVEGNKLRALPYKKADGSIDRTGLRTGLSRWDQVHGFTPAERVKALRKLRAASIKSEIVQPIATDTELQVENDRLQIEVSELLREVAEKNAFIEQLNAKHKAPKVEETQETPSDEEPTMIDKVENHGLALEKPSGEEENQDSTPAEKADVPTGETVLLGLLGNKRARKTLVKYTQKLAKLD